MNYPRACFIRDIDNLRKQFEKEHESCLMSESGWKKEFITWLAEQWTEKQ